MHHNALHVRASIAYKGARGQFESYCRLDVGWHVYTHGDLTAFEWRVLCQVKYYWAIPLPLVLGRQVFAPHWQCGLMIQFACRR